MSQNNVMKRNLHLAKDYRIILVLDLYSVVKDRSSLPQMFYTVGVFLQHLKLSQVLYCWKTHFPKRMPSKIAFTTTYFFCHFLHLSHKGLHSEKEMSVICAATSQGFPVYHSGFIPPPSPLFVKGGTGFFNSTKSGGN